MPRKTLVFALALLAIACGDGSPPAPPSPPSPAPSDGFDCASAAAVSGVVRVADPLPDRWIVVMDAERIARGGERPPSAALQTDGPGGTASKFIAQRGPRDGTRTMQRQQGEVFRGAFVHETGSARRGEWFSGDDRRRSRGTGVSGRNI